ncbi:MAG: tail fiber domain-containing protein [Flavobacteriales bacterium]|nr:tail fiber domain-containing protein [Flavobacteriales bacterium]
MREGFLATQGESLYYGGLIGAESGIIWSRTSGLMGPTAPFRFIYTGYNGGASVASSTPGLELARMQPDLSLNEGYFGIGDWNTAGVLPTERLDLLDGRVRIRQLPTDPAANSLTKIMVVDDAPGPEFGVVNWRDISTLTDCDWDLNGANDVVTAYASASSTCPDLGNNVGIGLMDPRWKLHVVEDTPLPHNDDKAIMAHTIGDDELNIGVDALCVGEPEHATNIGMRTWAQNGKVNYGLYAHTTVEIPYSIQSNVGVYGNAQEEGTSAQGGVSNSCIGIWGRAKCATPNTWAGYFDGNVYCAGAYFGSDAALKTNVQPVDNATDLLNQLSPVSYYFDTVQYNFMGVPSDLQYGLIAQDVAQVIPNIVKQVVRPAEYDTAGTMLHEAVSFKALNYNELIPLLLAVAKEQQATIQQQADRLDQMEQSLAACCNATDAVGGHAPIPNTGSDGTPGERSTTASTADLVIAPNPFAESTTVSYRLPQAGAVRLEVSSSAGMQLLTLREGQAEAGAYSLTWNT